MIQRTSLDALPTLFDRVKRQTTVLNLLKDLGEACNTQIANKLGWEINRVTPRVNELVKKGLVREHHKAIGPSGKRVIFWSTI